ncbi:hypothetical protein VCJ_002390 [Vibrio metoecus]|nr:hypothetical protein VCJ_002390 [Vibrio metoecus]
MGLKSSPTPIAKATGKPEQLLRDNNKKPREYSELKAEQIFNEIT